MLDMFNEPILVLNLSLIIFPNFTTTKKHAQVTTHNPVNIPTIVLIINL